MTVSCSGDLPLASAETVDRIAAVVNSEVITLSEVYDLASDFIQEREERSSAGTPSWRCWTCSSSAAWWLRRSTAWS